MRNPEQTRLEFLAEFARRMVFLPSFPEKCIQPKHIYAIFYGALQRETDRELPEKLRLATNFTT